MSKTKPFRPNPELAWGRAADFQAGSTRPHPAGVASLWRWCRIAERTPALRLTWGGPPRGKDGPSGRHGCGAIVECTQGLT